MTISRVPNKSRAAKDRLGSLSKSIETRRVVEKSTPMLCTRDFLLIKEWIYFISSTISSWLGVRDDLGRGETKTAYLTESSLRCSGPKNSLSGFW